MLRTPAPAQRFEVNAVDLLGSLLETQNGNGWVLVDDDLASKWVKLLPIKTASADACTKIRIKEVFLRFGILRKFVSNNEAQFISK